MSYRRRQPGDNRDIVEDENTVSDREDQTLVDIVVNTTSETGTMKETDLTVRELRRIFQRREETLESCL